MAMNVSQFQASDNFNMAEFNDMITQINSGVNSEVASLTTLINNGVKIKTGSYVGTGTYGSSNKCSLTFDFVPKIVVVGPVQITSSSTYNSIWMARSMSPAGWNSDDSRYSAYVTWGEKSVSWYVNQSGASAALRPAYQGNASNETYYYVAIG